MVFIARMKQLNYYRWLLMQRIRQMIFALGILMLLFIILSFTPLPFHAYHRLGTSNTGLPSTPDYIIVMGAGGMPGADGMIRCYYAARAASTYPNARLVVALPAEADKLPYSDHQRMIDDLLIRGVDSQRIHSELKGYNTHTQAVNIRKMIPEEEAVLLIVSAPEHMYRAIRTFQKQGFRHTGGLAAFENSFDAHLLLEEQDTEGRKKRSASPSLGLRYNMWGYMQYQILVVREYIAIGYYTVRGYM